MEVELATAQEERRGGVEQLGTGPNTDNNNDDTDGIPVPIHMMGYSGLCS